jgi:ABC-type transporter Mla subunit MlaD
MSSTKQDFVLGITVIAIVVIMIGSFFFVTEGPIFAPPTRDLIVEFSMDEGIARLKAGSAVTLRGAVDVGEVKKIEVIGGERGSIPIIRIVAHVNREQITLYKDARVSTTEGVIGGGGSLVILSVGTPDAGVLPEDVALDGERPQSFQAAIGELNERILGPDGLLAEVEDALDADRAGSLMHKLVATMDDVNAITGSLRTELTEDEETALLGQLHIILANVSQVTDRLAEEVDPQVRASLLAQVRGMLRETSGLLLTVRDTVDEGAPRIKQTLAHVEQAAETVNQQILQELAAEFDRTNKGALLARVHSSMAAAQRALDNVEAVTREGRQLVVLNRPLVQTTLRNVKEASSELKAGLAEIRTQPWRILTPPTEAEKARIVVFEAARQFADAAQRLDDVSSQMAALAEAVEDDNRVVTDEETIESMRTRLRAAFEQFEEAEAYFWQQIGQ